MSADGTVQNQASSGEPAQRSPAGDVVAKGSFAVAGCGRVAVVAGQGAAMARAACVAAFRRLMDSWSLGAVVWDLGRGKPVRRFSGRLWPTRRCPVRRRCTPTRRRGSIPGECLLFSG